MNNKASKKIRLSVGLLLGFFLVMGAYWLTIYYVTSIAKERLQVRAESLGWRISEVEIEASLWRGHISITNLEAYGQTNQSSLSIKNILLDVDVWAALTHHAYQTNAVIEDVVVTLNDEDIKYMMKRSTNDHPALSKKNILNSIQASNIQLNYQSSLANVILNIPSLTIGASRHFNVLGTMAIQSKKKEKNTSHPLQLSFESTEGGRRLTGRFEQSMVVASEDIGLAKFDGFTVHKNFDQLIIEVDALRWGPKDHSTVDILGVSSAKATLIKTSDRWSLTALEIDKVRASLYLRGLLEKSAQWIGPDASLEFCEALKQQFRFSETSCAELGTPLKAGQAMARDFIDPDLSVVLSNGHVELKGPKGRTVLLRKVAAQWSASHKMVEFDVFLTHIYAQYERLSKKKQSIRVDFDHLPAHWLLRALHAPHLESLSGSFNGQVKILLDEKAFRSAQATLTLKNGVVTHPKVSPQPIKDVFFTVKGGLERTSNMRGWSFRGHLDWRDRLMISLSGRWEQEGTEPLVEFLVSAPDGLCENIPDALPPGFASGIAGMTFYGQMTPGLKVSFQPQNPATSLTIRPLGIPGRCHIKDAGLYDVASLNSDDFIHITDYTYHKKNIRVGPGSNNYAPLNTLPSYVSSVMYLTEDDAFGTHNGVRLDLIHAAFRTNLEHGYFRYGGSTLHQQLTKNVFLTRDKTLERKLTELLLAWKMAETVSNDRVLELYVNVIEFGPDVYGITQAARAYFDKEPQHLTLVEAAFLAQLKGSPKRGKSLCLLGFKHPQRWHRWLGYALDKLKNNGDIDEVPVSFDLPSLAQCRLASMPQKALERVE